MEEEKLETKITQAYFKYGVEKAASELAEQVLDFTVETGASGGVIGLSGGIDSTTVAYLTKYAFDSYNKANPDNEKLVLYGISMPSKLNPNEDEDDAKYVAEKLGIEYKIIPIQPMAYVFIEQIPEELGNKFDVSNLYSELRAVVLSRFAGSKNLRVMGTGNHDEDYVLGYFTKRGDGAVDNNILGNLPKRLVRELAEFLGVPKRLVKRIPTAGLEEGQTDEKDLGMNYEQAEIIQRGYDLGMTAKDIQKRTGYDLSIILKEKQLHESTKHKRNLPPVGNVTLEYK